MLLSPAVPGCCLVSFYFLCYILCSHSEEKRKLVTPGKLRSAAAEIQLDKSLSMDTLHFKVSSVDDCGTMSEICIVH